jgi:hypothetical protein
VAALVADIDFTFKEAGGRRNVGRWVGLWWFNGLTLG